MEQTPVSLLERVRRPADQAAWGRFVELYTPVIYGWARTVGLQEADASDLVQDVFAILVRKMPEFAYDRQRSFRAWLKTITLNKFRENRRRPQFAGLPDGDALEDSADSNAYWEAEYRQQVFRRALEIMQADFEPATWQACLQVVVDRRPGADVAKHFGISVGAVYAARFRVLARLRRELAGLLD